jgi:hypothetical protein
MRLLISAVLVTSTFCTPTFAQDVCSLLHRQTQEFSDAGQQGKGSIMASYLDDAVVFFNEGGDRATKTDMSKNGSPVPGVDRTITTTDWDCKMHGDVASLNGGPASVQKAQARDIFFTTGHGATPKVFQRDSGGKITGLVYLRGNHSLTFKRVG